MEEDFDVLVQDIIKNPERLLDKNISDEQILEIQKRLNPYAGIGGIPPVKDKKKIVACSYTNLREDYIKRFTMTSLIGFVYQIFKEWEVPVEKRRWVPPSKSKEVTEPFTPSMLVQMLEANLAIAKEAELSSKGVASSVEEADKIYGKTTGLMYAATYALHRNGIEASARLKSSAEDCLRFPEVREIIEKKPIPQPYGQLEIPSQLSKDIIGNFLNTIFKFDPSVHVRSADNTQKIKEAFENSIDKNDPTHLPLPVISQPAVVKEDHKEIMRELSTNKNCATHILRNLDFASAVKEMLKEPEVYKQYLYPITEVKEAIDTIPSQDTFHRWNYYTEVNYEELKTITDAIYPERSDLDFAIGLWNVFEGTSAEVDDQFDKHCKRYQDEVPSSIKALEFGGWSLLSDLKENRKNIQIYNKNTEILKRILDRHADDKRIGSELMRNRIKQVKAKNIAEDGADAEGLKEYTRQQNEKGQAVKAEKVISQEEMKRLEKTKGNIKAAKELEVIESFEKQLTELSEIEKTRPLIEKEIQQRDQIQRSLKMAKEMIEVPEEAVQIDVFTTTGDNISKSHFYTASDEELIKQNIQSSETTPLSTSTHPAVMLTMKK